MSPKVVGVIKEKRGAPTISINNEYQTHGKPVEVTQVSRGNFKLYMRLSGEYTAKKQVQIWVSKIQWAKIKRGQSVNILGQEEGLPSELLSGKGNSGKVAHIAKSPSNLTGLYQVVVSSENGLKLKPGSKVVVDIQTRQAPGVLSVPSSAIKQLDTSFFVWLLNNGKASKVEVKTGRESNLYTEILSGLEPGDKVIVRGGSSLKKGDSVRVVGEYGADKNNEKANGEQI